MKYDYDPLKEVKEEEEEKIPGEGLKKEQGDPSQSVAAYELEKIKMMRGGRKGGAADIFLGQKADEIIGKLTEGRLKEGGMGMQVTSEGRSSNYR